MKYIQLGSSDLSVSQVCLGTMTWGEQNTQKDADQQIEYALSKGINFFDTAEMYAVPPKPETQGATEKVFGDWLARHPEKRKDMIIATKITGVGIPWIRDGGEITGEAIKKAVDQSLVRLQTDYIDVYQLHWPNRTSPHFSKHWPKMVPHHEVDVAAHRAQFLEILQAIDECIKAGKIRHFGLSDDTPWGIKEYLNLAKEHNLPKVVSIQNEFNLLHLKDSPYLIETCVLDDVAYLPWSPLASGVLSGKYRYGKVPEGSRWSMSARNGLFRDTEMVHKAVEAYAEIAKQYNLSLAQLSLAWIYQFPGVSSTIIGATTMDQLSENIEAYNITLDDQVMLAIDKVIRQYPVPF